MLRDEAQRFHAMCAEALVDRVESAVLAAHNAAAGRHAEAARLYLCAADGASRCSASQTTQRDILRQVLTSCALCDETAATRKLELRALCLISATWCMLLEEQERVQARFHVLLETDAKSAVTEGQIIITHMGDIMFQSTQASWFDEHGPAGLVTGKFSREFLARFDHTLMTAVRRAFAGACSPIYGCYGAFAALGCGSHLETALGPGGAHVEQALEQYRWPEWNQELLTLFSFDPVILAGALPLLSYYGQLSKANKAHATHTRLLEQWLDHRPAYATRTWLSHAHL